MGEEEVNMNLFVNGMGARISITKKADAIKSGLTPYLTAQQLDTAITYWHENYSQQPAFVIQRFVRDICKQFNLNEQRLPMLQAVVDSLNKLLVEEQTNTAKQTQHSQVDTTHRTNHLEVNHSEQQLACFIYLVKALNNHVAEVHKTDFFQQVINEVNQTRLKPNLKKAFANWLNLGFGLTQCGLDITFTTVDLRKLVSCTYSCLCYFLGPVEADQALVTSIAQTEQKYDKDLVAKLL